MSRSLSIVLAAGEGTRMRSSLPKVLHEIAGRSLLAHVLAAVDASVGGAVAVVVGPDHDKVAAEARRVTPQAEIFVQQERRGTAHAVLSAEPALARPVDEVLIVFGDTPLIRPETLNALRTALTDGAAVAVLGFRPAEPKGYGRLLVENGALLAIREEADASDRERTIGLCNAGLMGLSGRVALDLLRQVGNANKKGEFYLTDVVEIARARGLQTVAVEVDEDDVRGINTKAQLAEAETVMQSRLRARMLDAGVTMTAPETVYLAADTLIGRDVLIEPFVVCGPGVVIGDGAVIHAFSHLSGAHVGRNASVGPYARLRPGADLGDKTRVGNFVEVKAARLDAGAKVNHLSYIGDAHVGSNANIGAGTITCNYDGAAKHRTEIGAGAFIGSNSALVAPVAIGEGAYVGSGSVITQNVPADALAVGRGRQSNKPGWAARLRAMAAGRKPGTTS